MNEIKLNRNTLIKLGNTISEILLKSNVKSESYLNICVDEYSFKKIDEDLYYRNGNNEHNFEPSEKTIQLKFPNLTILIDKNN